MRARPSGGRGALGVPPGLATGFAYAVLAVASGFAADKILRNMIDSVLKRLHEKAEKTVKTKAEQVERGKTSTDAS